MNTTLKRSLSGIVFLVIMIGGLLVGPVAFNLLFLFISVVMVWEFLHITMGERHKGMQWAACGVAALLFLSVGLVTGAALPVRWLGLDLIFVLLLMIAMVLDHAEFKEYAYVFTALGYIGVPLALSHFVVMQGGTFDGTLMLAFFILIWSSDVGAYCFGMLLGQKVWPAKMCPEISPKKSWAGFCGGWVLTLAAVVILVETGMLAIPMGHALVMATLMHVAGVFGDLFESLWKRQFGVKDSGNILPGHGGLMDRFDSALFAIPVGTVYLSIFGLL